MEKAPRRALVLALLLLATGAMAQETPLYRPSQEAELWISGGIELRLDKDAQKRIKKAKDGRESGKLTGEDLERAEQRAAKAERSFKNRFRMSGELGYRGNENLTSGKLIYTVLGMRYRPHKYARLTMEHRYNFRGPYSSNTHRIDVQADTDKNFGRFTAGYRLVYQHEFVVPIRYRDILRNRFQLAYRTKAFPVDPYLSAESFTAFHYTGNKLIGLRYGIGAEWQLDKDHALDLSLRHDREQNLPGLKYRWIFGIAYEFKWRK